MSIRSLLTSPSRPFHPVYVYGMLGLIGMLLFVTVLLLLATPPPYTSAQYRGFVVPLMLLFNHLAYQFRWPAPVTAVLRLLCWGSTVFGGIYIFCFAKP